MFEFQGVYRHHLETQPKEADFVTITPSERGDVNTDGMYQITSL